MKVIFVIVLFFLSCESVIPVVYESDGSKLVLTSSSRVGDSLTVAIYHQDSQTFDELNNLIIRYYFNDVYQGDLELKSERSYSKRFYVTKKSDFVIPESGEVRIETEFRGNTVSTSSIIPKPVTIKSASFNIDKVNEKEEFKLEVESPLNTIYSVEYSFRDKRITYSGNRFNKMDYGNPFRYSSGEKQIHEWINNYFGDHRVISFLFEIKVNSFTESYSQFYTSKENQNDDEDFLTILAGGEHNDVYSNVENGFGIFSIVNTTEWSNQ